MSEAKRLAAEKALDYVEDGMIVGVGTGSTVAYFIDALGREPDRIKGAVSSSDQSTEQLKKFGIEILDLNHAGELSLYVDGADECDPHKRLIKGGGAALTREVIPMARSLVARRIASITGGQPVFRMNAQEKAVITDNGNVILDIHHLSIVDPVAIEAAINQIPGVVSVGLFARRPADVVIVGGEPPRLL